jgi:hypothetical protein
MARRSKVTTLPKEVKAWLDANLIEGNFSGYEALAGELSSRGYQIGKSALHRYGQEFETRLTALKMASEQAKAVAEAIPDDENAMSDALIRLVQQKAFEMLIKMEGDPNVSFGTLGKIAGELGSVSTQIRKFRNEVRAKAQAAADQVEQVVKQAGLSADAAATIRREILGIAHA